MENRGGSEASCCEACQKFQMNEIDVTDSEELDMTNFYYQFLKLERSVSDPNYSGAQQCGPDWWRGMIVILS